jgi:hypothetical protein
VAAEFLGDRLIPAFAGAGSCGSKPLHVYLRQRRHQRPLGALIAFEQFGQEPSGAILRHAQLELADPDDQRPPVIA